MFLKWNGGGFKSALKALGIVVVLLGSLSGLRSAEANGTPVSFSREQKEFYEKQIRPLLSENCFKCHSHQAEKIKGGLVLDSREGALKGGDSGPALVPGDAEKSLMIRAVRQVDQDLQMPPKKQLADDQIALLAKWINMGAPYGEEVGGQRSEVKDQKRWTTTQDRKWWSYQPLQEVKVPEVRDGGWSRNEVDKFIFARLRAEGLAPSPEADKRVLIRRVYLDLIGLPPSPEEVGRFIADKAPDAYEKVAADLLGSPRYGEKWARHWLDLVRYAESDGYKSDGYRPNAWRYRDYVIKSLNEDKPYNRFLMEQIAADELWPDDPEALAGLNYLRLPIYEYNQRNVKGQWDTILNDITDVTGDAFLGVGFQCARCHDHKFDPILQRDYYRLEAFFAALSPRDDLPLATPTQLKEYRAQLATWEEKTADLRAQIAELERPVREKTAQGVMAKLPKEIQAIMKKPAGERTPYEQQINDLAYRQVTEEFEKLDGKFKGSEKQKLDALELELAKFDELKPKPLPEAMLVIDIGPKAPPISIPKDKTHTPIEPGFLTLLGETAQVDPIAAAPNSSGRRAALAKWLAASDNRFTTRVIVNRIWQRHFGRGLVANTSDFGHLGEPPTHPELLDWLAGYFVEHGWSLKELHRLIVTSATYRQGAGEGRSQRAEVSDQKAEVRGQRSEVGNVQKSGIEVDPENKWLWRQNLRRLEADQIRDAMLWASGELDLKNGGPSVDASKPRRTIYTKWLRNTHDPLIEAFDPPDAYISTPQRNVTTTPMQSMVMINGPYALQRAQALGKRVNEAPNSKLQAAEKPQSSISKSQTDRDVADQVTAAYRCVYSREPSASEKASAVKFLKEQTDRNAKSEALARAEAEAMPRRSGTAAAFHPGSIQTRLQVPDNHLMPQYDFTIEAFVLLRSVDSGVELRTILSRWDGRKDQPGWSLGVAGKKPSGPGLALELIGDPAEDGAGGYEAIPSGLRIELDTPYYVAVSVRIGDTSETGVTFYLKELTAGAPVQIARRPHKVTANHQSNLPLTIGGRDPEKHQIWDGLIDDVRLTSRALKQDDLLLAREGADESTVGYWRFEEPDFFKDSSPNGHNIRSEISPTGQADPKAAALIDFCHVLLNSSEFLYAE